MNFVGPLAYPLVFGTWQLGGDDWGPIPSWEAKDLLAAAWDTGFRHYDSAERYGNGRSEQLIAQALRSVLRTDRESISISSKSEVRPPRSLTRHLERSLRRLDTEYLDVYYIHWPRTGVDLGSAIEELERNRERGLIRAIGLSNISVAEWEQVRTAGRIDALQLGYNLIWRRMERDFGALLSAGGATPAETPSPRLLAYSPLAQGLLAHRFPLDRAQLPEDHRRDTPLFSPPAWSAVHTFASDMIREVQDNGLQPAAIALSWVVRQGAIPVVGVHNAQQLRSLVAGLEELRSAPTERVDALLSNLTQRSDRLQAKLPPIANMFGYAPRPCDPPKSGIHT